MVTVYLEPSAQQVTSQLEVSSEAQTNQCDFAPRFQEETVSEEGHFFDESGNKIKFKKWQFDASKDGIRCEWVKETVTIFSTGAISNGYVLKNHGAFGDPSPRCFETDLKILNSAREIIASSAWKEPYISAPKWGPAKPYEGQFLNRLDELRDHFDDLEIIQRALSCKKVDDCRPSAINE